MARECRGTRALYGAQQQGHRLEAAFLRVFVSTLRKEGVCGGSGGGKPKITADITDAGVRESEDCVGGSGMVDTEHA